MDTVGWPPKFASWAFSIPGPRFCLECIMVLITLALKRCRAWPHLDNLTFCACPTSQGSCRTTENRWMWL